MDRQTISRLAHARHPVAAPLSDGSVGALLDRALAPDEEGRALDLGCGRAAWLLRALSARPRWRAVGVEVDAAALDLARESAEALGVQRRVALHHQDAREFAGPGRFELVLNVGATHVFGGLLPALAAAREFLAPGGRVLVGEGFWERDPSSAALASLGATREEYADLATTVDRVTADGWTPVAGHVSGQEEWDDYEFSWTGSLAEWALDHPEHPDAADARAAADLHRVEWLHGYRGTLGFVTLLLRQG
ncbi:class I SAM-dependent methyltransferase [Kitasatospora sp. NPDC097605]|uniref:SAM-dependent methyltransferase n=1 Tax=Kitasatospora sp. NPDC097605 TaxID=3157226 RepID=UPI00332830E8